MATLKKGISLIVVTKNEEYNLRDCIQSAKKLAQEVHVIDMHSSDNTPKIAKEMGAITHTVQDYGYVEPARNFAIDQAQYEWVMVLDADERLTPTLITKLHQIVKEDVYDVLKVPRQNIILGKWIQQTGWWPDYQIRFFKKGFVEWNSQIHSVPTWKGRIGELPAKREYSIIHHNYNSVDHLLSKMLSYTKKESELEQEKIKSSEYVLSYMENEFYDRYIDKKGFLDKSHGFILSKFMEFYKFIELMRFWEKNKYKDFKGMVDLHEIVMKRRHLLDNTDIKSIKTSVLEENTQLKNELKEAKKRITDIENQLHSITSAKFFKVWQKYVNVKNSLLHR
jgi:glycosyltransferase involved in cell wall biosynthesis